MGALVKSDAVLASNTSSLPITAMGVASGRPTRFLGLHFFNHVQAMWLVEVVRTEHISSEMFDRIITADNSICLTRTP